MISHQRAWGRGLSAIRHDPDSTLNFPERVRGCHAARTLPLVEQRDLVVFAHLSLGDHSRVSLGL